MLVVLIQVHNLLLKVNQSKLFYKQLKKRELVLTFKNQQLIQLKINQQ